MTYNQLVWAAGIFHSRAIMIPSKDRSSRARCEALTPLIDLLNHRPGYLSELQRRPSMLAESNTTTSRALQKQDVVVYTVGRTIQANEQIFLNYGPKSNEDLLAHFGFCLDKNRMPSQYENPRCIDHRKRRARVEQSFNLQSIQKT